MSLRPLSDVGPADWITSADAPWFDLVTFGPPGFDAYLRLVRTDDDDQLLRALCGVLARHTTTPDDAHFCLWDGYGTLDGGRSSYAIDPDDPRLDTDPLGGTREERARRLLSSLPEERYPAAFPPSVLNGPRVKVGDRRLPERAYLLFGGALSDAGDWGADPRHPGGIGEGIPNLFWPADHAWCVAADVDEDADDEWRLGVGGTQALIDALHSDARFETVPVHPYA
ncbi:hypothetical protein FE697_014900 [Mumia zhuanghuii]|uniref:Uncharacterized protein n=2 Tax=Mumia TaxID=1546255 RepID=A0ABW1QQR0_9ACTN|nr:MULTISPECIES: hypothetical protein [Mumia]KAA1422432.1 hypothetical protein FE697_014900 [Mumia zhuanghuii]